MTRGLLVSWLIFCFVVLWSIKEVRSGIHSSREEYLETKELDKEQKNDSQNDRDFVEKVNVEDDEDFQDEENSEDDFQDEGNFDDAENIESEEDFQEEDHMKSNSHIYTNKKHSYETFPASDNKHRHIKVDDTTSKKIKLRSEKTERVEDDFISKLISYMKNLKEEMKKHDNDDNDGEINKPDHKTGRKLDIEPQNINKKDYNEEHYKYYEDEYDYENDDEEEDDEDDYENDEGDYENDEEGYKEEEEGGGGGGGGVDDDDDDDDDDIDDDDDNYDGGDGDDSGHADHDDNDEDEVDNQDDNNEYFEDYHEETYDKDTYSSVKNSPDDLTGYDKDIQSHDSNLETGIVDSNSSNHEIHSKSYGNKDEQNINKIGEEIEKQESNEKDQNNNQEAFIDSNENNPNPKSTHGNKNEKQRRPSDSNFETKAAKPSIRESHYEESVIKPDGTRVTKISPEKDHAENPVTELHRTCKATRTSEQKIQQSNPEESETAIELQEAANSAEDIHNSDSVTEPVSQHEKKKNRIRTNKNNIQQNNPKESEPAQLQEGDETGVAKISKTKSHNDELVTEPDVKNIKTTFKKEGYYEESVMKQDGPKITRTSQKHHDVVPVIEKDETTVTKTFIRESHHEESVIGPDGTKACNKTKPTTTKTSTKKNHDEEPVAELHRTTRTTKQKIQRSNPEESETAIERSEAANSAEDMQNSGSVTEPVSQPQRTQARIRVNKTNIQRSNPKESKPAEPHEGDENRVAKITKSKSHNEESVMEQDVKKEKKTFKKERYYEQSLMKQDGPRITRTSQKNHDAVPVVEEDGTRVAKTSIKESHHEESVIEQDGTRVTKTSSIKGHDEEPVTEPHRTPRTTKQKISRNNPEESETAIEPQKTANSDSLTETEPVNQRQRTKDRIRINKNNIQRSNTKETETALEQQETPNSAENIQNSDSVTEPVSQRQRTKDRIRINKNNLQRSNPKESESAIERQEVPNSAEDIQNSDSVSQPVSQRQRKKYRIRTSKCNIQRNNPTESEPAQPQIAETSVDEIHNLDPVTELESVTESEEIRYTSAVSDHNIEQETPADSKNRGIDQSDERDVVSNYPQDTDLKKSKCQISSNCRNKSVDKIKTDKVQESKESDRTFDTMLQLIYNYPKRNKFFAALKENHNNPKKDCTHSNT